MCFFFWGVGGYSSEVIVSYRFRFLVMLINKCQFEKYSHFSISRMAGRAAGHRYKVGGWDTHVGEANPRAAIFGF